MVMNNEAFEEWWGKNWICKVCEFEDADGYDIKTAYEAGQLNGENQGLEKAAQHASDNPDHLTSHINGIPYISISIRRLKT
jgi:hypothetical protein